jgi:hypothetical protein
MNQRIERFAHGGSRASAGLLMAVAALAGCGSPPVPGADLVVRNARLVAETGEVVEPATIVIDAGLITRVTRGADSVLGRDEVDAAGRTIIPGLIDADAILPAGSGESLRAILEDYLARGVTTILVRNGPAPGILASLRRADAGEIPAPRVVVSGEAAPPGEAVDPCGEGMERSFRALAAAAGFFAPRLGACLSRAGVSGEAAGSPAPQPHGCGSCVRAAAAAGVAFVLATGGAPPGGGTAVLREMGLLNAEGISPAELIAAATSAPARAYPSLADSGSIEAGRRADLVAIEGDPTVDLGALARVRIVILGGRVVLDRRPR